MRSHLDIIDGIFRKDSAKVIRVERDQMISALAPDRPGGAYPKPPWRYRPDALMTHDAFDAATAHHIPPGAQGCINPGRAIAAAMCHMDPPDLGQQGAIGRLAQTFRPATPGIIPRRRDTYHIEYDARLALVRDEAEFHLGASEKMRSVFFGNYILDSLAFSC
jgi:hypothetical protein